MSERDLGLKLKLMKFLWYNGYFVKKDVDLANYQYGERTSSTYTDVDVFAIKFDEKFDHHQIISECKSGRTAKNVDKILWLGGLVAYLEVDEGIFLRNQIDEKKYFYLSKRLNITPLSLRGLLELESSQNINEKDCIGAFNPDVLDKEDLIFKKLKNSIKTVHDYLKFGYWNDSYQRQIRLLTTSLTEIKEYAGFTDKERNFLQVYILSLISISILKFSKPILIFPSSHQEEYIKETILGEEIEINERKQILGKVYDFLVDQSTEFKGENHNKDDFINIIYLDFSKYLIDLIQRICKNPITARQIPRLLDVIAYDVILNDNKNNIKEKLFSHNNDIDLELLVKTSKNLIIFAFRSGFITKEDYDVLNILMSRLYE